MVEPRIAGLIEEFDRYVTAYDEQVPFQRSGQYEEHRRTIDRRRRYDNVESALADDRFLHNVWTVLQKWGIGTRGSRLVPLEEFTRVVREERERLAAVQWLSIDHPDLDADVAADQLWPLVTELDVVDNKARIVAATKTLHHLLPEIVPPMDRAWTGAFFGWTVLDPQNDQERTFKETYRSFVEVAKRTRPSRLVGGGWRTSSTKILDNAIIGYCKLHGLGPGADASRESAPRNDARDFRGVEPDETENDVTSQPDRERQFTLEMERGAATLKRELGYNPTRWMQMVHEHGGVEAARRLLRGSDYSEGFVKLWEAGRLDMTVEWFVLVYDDLFTDDERQIAYNRLRQYEVPVDEWLRAKLGRRHP